MFSSGNKHSSNHKAGCASSRWPTAPGPTVTTPSAERVAPSESSVYDSSWELSRGCEVAELSDVPAEWKDLTS